MLLYLRDWVPSNNLVLATRVQPLRRRGYCYSPLVTYSYIALHKDIVISVTLFTNSSSSLYQFTRALSYKSVYVKNPSQLCSLFNRLLLSSSLVDISLSSSILYIKRESIGIDPASWLRSSQDRIIESLLDNYSYFQKCLEILEFVNSKDLRSIKEKELVESKSVKIDNDN